MDPRRVISQLKRGGRRHLVVMVGLAGFVVAVYVVIVLGGGAIIGRTDSPSLPLSVLATAVVALLFAPVQAGPRPRRDQDGTRRRSYAVRRAESILGDGHRRRCD